MEPISNELHEFLKENKIYSLNILRQLSITAVARMAGFNDELKEELEHIFGKTRGRQKQFPLVERERNYNKFKVIYYKGVEVKTSNRLYNIIVKNGFQNDFKKLLLLNNNELLSFNNLGKKTLKEIEGLRRKYLGKQTIDNASTDYNKTSMFNIKIPPLVKSLPINSIILLHRGLPDLMKSISSINKYFSLIGDLNGLDSNQLLKIHGLGLKKINPIWQWFDELAQGDYKNIFEKHLQNEHDILFDDIHHSYIVNDLLESYEISKFSQLTILDNLNEADLTANEKHALLEIRTLFFDEKNRRISTRTNHPNKEFNLIADLDEYFLNFLSDKYEEYGVRRWGSKNNESLERLGNNYNLTRERFRQIFNIIKQGFISYFVFDKKELGDHLIKIIYRKLKYLSLEDLGNSDDYNKKYPESLYVNFFSELFFPIPICKQTRKSIQLKFSKIKSEMYKKAKFPYSYKVDDALIFDNEHLIEKINILLNRNSGLKIVEKDGIRYINRATYSQVKLAKHIIISRNKPLKIDEIIENIVKIGGKTPSKQGFIGRLKNTKGIYNLDYEVFGTIEHFRYPKTEWRGIQNVCERIIDDVGHQMGAGFIYRSVTKEYPKLRSKYELVYILRDCNSILDLGFFNFTSIKYGVHNRKLVKDVAKNILDKSIIPISADQLYKDILKERTYTREGMTSLHKQCKIIDLYKPAYYGLTSKKEKNINFLSTHIPYIENYIIWKTQKNDDLRIKKIMREIYYKGTENDFIQMIDEFSQKLSVQYVNENNFDSYLVHSIMSLNKCAAVILAVYNRPMLYNEIKVILINNYNLGEKKRYFSGLKGRLIKNNRIIRDGNTFSYNPMVENYEMYSELIEEVLLVVNDWGEYITIYELYSLLEGIDNLPLTNSHLLGLIALDERFEIINNSLITVKNNVK